MKICPSCGSIANDDVTICSTCGYNLTQVNQTNLATGQNVIQQATTTDYFNPIFQEPFAQPINNSMNNTFGQPMNNSINNTMGNTFGQPMNNSMNNTMGNTFGQPMDNSMNNTMGNTFGQPMDNSMNNTMGNTFGQPMDNSMNNTMGNTFGQPMDNSMNNTMGNTFGQPMDNAINNPVNQPVNSPVTDLGAQESTQQLYQDPIFYNPTNQANDQPYPWHPADAQKKKKLPVKAMLLFFSIIAGILLIGFGVYTIVMSKKTPSGLTKKEEKQIHSSIKEYAESFNKLDVKGVVESTIPTELIKDIFLDLAVDTNSAEFKDYSENFDSYYSMALAAGSLALTQTNTKINITNLEIGEVNKVNISEKFDEMISNIEENSLYADDILDQIDEIKSTAKKYGLDLDEIYAVDISFDCEAIIDGRDYSFKSEEYITKLYAYKYKDKFYFIPGIEDYYTSTVSSQFNEYTDKSSKSSDLINAQIIKVAIEVALCDEKNYEYMTTTLADQLIEFSEDGLRKIDSKLANELVDSVGEYPEVEYTHDGQKNFVFKVSKKGEVTIYISNGSKLDAWEISPNPSPEYE